MKQIVTDLLDSMGLGHKDSGQDFILTQCMSPDHDDSNPSMFIQTEIGYGRCQGCGFEVFPETFIKDEASLEHHKLISGYQQIKKKLEIEQLVEGEDVFYLPEVSETIEEYRGLSQEIIDKAGLYISKKGRYENRVIMPFYSKGNVLRGFTSRWIGEVPNSSFPKYLHSSGIRTSDVILYGQVIVDLKLNPSTLYIVEGNMDSLALLSLGIPATPSLGFRTPSDLWVIESIMLGVDKVVILWDSDSAGSQHMTKLFKEWNDKIPTTLGYYDEHFSWFYKSKYKDPHEALEALGIPVMKSFCNFK